MYRYPYYRGKDWRALTVVHLNVKHKRLLKVSNSCCLAKRFGPSPFAVDETKNKIHLAWLKSDP